jgi:hypothetical protein
MLHELATFNLQPSNFYQGNTGTFFRKNLAAPRVARSRAASMVYARTKVRAALRGSASKQMNK